MKHFKFLILLLSVFSLSSGFAQTTFDVDLRATMLKNMKKLKQGTSVNFKSLTYETVFNEFSKAEQKFLLIDQNGDKLEINRNFDNTFDFQYHDVQEFWDGMIINKVIWNLQKNGFQPELRKEMEEDALGYVREIQSHGLEFEDPYLESYIYGLAFKIMPKRLLDGRSPQINILLQQSPTPHCGVYPNGTIILNTGLLSVLHSEDELVAVLARGIAYFVLDHSILNVNLAEQRARRAEFWSALLTGITAVGEGVAAASGNYYTPGLATVGVAALSSEIGKKIVKRLGMEYTYEQKKEAETVAGKILELLGYDKNALSAALTNIDKLHYQEYNNTIYAESSGYSDSLDQSMKRDVAFEQMVSFAVTNQAMLKYADRRFARCVKFLDQNIENHVATADDYILKAKCLLAMSNTEESNREILDLLAEAKAIGQPVSADRIEIIVNLRMNQREKAVALLKDYINKLSGMGGVSTDIYKTELLWKYNSEFVGQEIAWARKMLIKLHGMMGAEAPMPIAAAGV